MAEPGPSDRQTPKPLVKQLDRWVGEVNTFLVVLAVGLAILDATCFTALRFNASSLAITGVHTGDTARTPKAANLAP
jgi:hypothetical protein